MLLGGSHQDKPPVYSDVHPACRKLRFPVQKTDSENAAGIMIASQSCVQIPVTPWHSQHTVILTPTGHVLPEQKFVY